MLYGEGKVVELRWLMGKMDWAVCHSLHIFTCYSLMSDFIMHSFRQSGSYVCVDGRQCIPLHKLLEMESGGMDGIWCVKGGGG